MSKFQNIKKTFGGNKQSPQGGKKFTKSDLNNIEDADFEEIKK